MSVKIHKFRCERTSACPLAADPNDRSSIICINEQGEWADPYPRIDDEIQMRCPSGFDGCTKNLKEIKEDASKAWFLYGGIALALIIGVILLFTLTGQPSEKQRKENAAKQLKEIWPWLQVR